MEKEGENWFQCKICKVICTSRPVMMLHEKRHGGNNNHSSGISSMSVWLPVKVEVETDGVEEILQEDHQLEEAKPPQLAMEKKNRRKAKHLPSELRNDWTGEINEVAKDEFDQYITPGPLLSSPRASNSSRVKKPVWRPHQLRSVRNIGKPKPKPIPEPTRKSKRVANLNALSPGRVPVAKAKAGKVKVAQKVKFARTVKVSPKAKIPLNTVGFTIQEDCRIVVDRDPATTALDREAYNGDKTCSLCGFIGRNMTDLIDHKRTHTKEKPYKCPVCPNLFSRTQNMRHHIRFNCVEAKRQGLAEQFNQRAAEITQKSKYSPPADFECPDCVEKFNSTIKLTHHIRVHSVGKDGKVFTCSFCNAGFYSSRSVSDHQARMHNKHLKSEFQCRHCSKNLASSSSLKRHIYLHHYDEGEENSGPSLTNISDSQSVSQDTLAVKPKKSVPTKKQPPKLDAYWEKKPKIVKVEEVLPSNNNGNHNDTQEDWTWPMITSTSQLRGKSSSTRLPYAASQMVKIDQSLITHGDGSLEEPEMEINESAYLLGNDPLAF